MKEQIERRLRTLLVRVMNWAKPPIEPCKHVPVEVAYHYQPFGEEMSHGEPWAAAITMLVDHPLNAEIAHYTLDGEPGQLLVHVCRKCGGVYTEWLESEGGGE